VTSLEEVLAQRAAWRGQGRRVVFTNGCFDVIHPGHLALLETARSQGDVLVVGINSDRSVREIKGPSRPVFPETERVETLLALEPVDRVVVYDEPTPLETIRQLRPDVLVKGADWALEDIVGRDVVEERGGRVVRVDLLPGRSTTAILDRIRRT
jgi:D-glycero-beta-D-manno-heptose 1-phosphate adenylyltransferase